MTYQVQIERKAARSIQALDRPIRSRVQDAIRALADDPRPPGAIRLTGADGWRLRVGDYRIVYTVRDQLLVVTVVEVGHRSSVYRRL